jgi:small subunit ribosomal protein S6
MAPTPAYDLLVLLDPEVPEERRTALIDQIKRQIDSGEATLKGDADWGMRRLSYEIDHRREAQYHLFQFEGTAEVLTQLNRSLSIDDSVLRHRIIKLPGPAPEVTPRPPEEAPRRPDDRGDRRDRRDEREGAPEGETPAAPPETATAEPEAATAAPEAPAPEAPAPEAPAPEAAPESGAPAEPPADETA